MKPVFLGLDLGTTAVKGVAVSAGGEILAETRFERPARYPRPGWVEMEARADWWEPAVTVISRLLTQLGSRTKDVLALGVSGLVPCLCLLDENNQPLRPAILYSDNRALTELEWVNRQTGSELSAQAVTPKLVWIQRNEPELFARARTVLSTHNYIVMRLTGRACLDYDTASILGGVFRGESKTYDMAAFQKMGLPGSLWPELLPGPSSAGGVTREAALETGLPEGTLVLVGSGDTFPGIIGCGAVDPGDAAIAIGTTGLLTLTQRSLLETALGPHFEDGSILWPANVLSAGQLPGWFRHQFSQTQTLQQLDENAARIPAGAEGLIALPHWLGRRTPLSNPNLRGALIGLTPSHGADHIYRALLEAFAYNLRQGFDPIRTNVRRLVATGGGAASQLWRQILADVLETEIEYSPRSSTALGSAYLAAWSSGAVHEFDTIKRKWLQDSVQSRPNPDNFPGYRQNYRAYQALDNAIEEATQAIETGEL